MTYDPNSALPPRNPSNGMAIASLVLGIVGLLLAMIPFVGMISWILAPLGLILGFVALNKPGGRGMAIGGLITSGLALLLCILWVVGIGALVASSPTVTTY